MVAASGFHGVAHFDMRQDERDGSVKILECNPRFWATLRESMWNGTNFIECCVRMAEGQPHRQPKINRCLTYAFPAKVLAAFLKGDFSAPRRLSLASWRDAWQTFSDPLTFAYQVKRKFFRMGAA